MQDNVNLKQKHGFLLFEILIAGMLLSLWLASMVFFFQHLRIKQYAITTFEHDLFEADKHLARAFSGESLDPEKARSHGFGGGLQLIEIPIASSAQSLWIVIP